MGRGSLVGCRLWGHRVGHDWSDLAAAAASYGFVWWLNSKESAGNAGDTGDASLISGLGRSSGGGNGYPLQYSCRENPMDRGAWWATVHGFTKGWTRLRDWAPVHKLWRLIPTEYQVLCWTPRIRACPRYVQKELTGWGGLVNMSAIKHKTEYGTQGGYLVL